MSAPIPYAEFDLRTGTLSKLPHPTQKQALWVAKRVWRRTMGQAWPGTWRAGRGNHRSYPRHGATGWFLVNPGQGWAGIVHDMSHTAFDYVTKRRSGWHKVVHPRVLANYAACGRSGNRHHNLGHAELERQMVKHAIALIGELD
jgi:hypothetical protein